MEYREIQLTIQNNVGTLTLFRPNRGNALTSTLLSESQHALQHLESDPSVRVIILTGSGKFFCTGMDLSLTMDHQGESSKKSTTFPQLLEQFKNCKKPILSRINGGVLGGGIGLIFTTDVRIALKSAFFSFAEVKRGLVPAIISAYIVPELGTFRSRQLMLTGEKISAQKAYEMGFLTAITEDDQALNDLTSHYVNELLSSAPGAMSMVKSTIRFVCCHSHEENLKHVSEVFAKMMQSPEASYGLQCFLQKEKPDWNKVSSSL